jgi:hypothetical protein
MTRKTYVFINGGCYEKGSSEHRAAAGYQEGQSAPAVIGDDSEFVSPLDGKVYSGRAGMREHCARHDVVSNRDLVGMPTLSTNSDFRSTQQKRSDADSRKRLVINEVNKHYR